MRIIRPLALTCLALAGTLSLVQGAQSPQAPCPRPPKGAAFWSDPGSWPSGTVPKAGECRTIPAGTTLYLDVSSAPLGGLDVQGELVFLCRNLVLTADWIRVAGRLEVGATTHPFHREARIQLTNSFACNAGQERQSLVVEGQGVWRMVGKTQGPGWTRLASTALKGSNTLVLETAPGWSAGQTVVIASTDFDSDQAEEHRILSVVGNVLTIHAPLQYTHWGESVGQAYDGIGVDERAEVALLDRRIVVEGTPIVDAQGRTLAGHTMLHKASGSGPLAELQGVEFRQLGKEGVLARYPVHFHQLGAAAGGSSVRDCSIHHCFNRAISLHASEFVTLEGNVAYDTIGHTYYMEGDLTRNCTLRSNLGLGARPAAFPILASDTQPAIFWMHNPANTVEDNVAAGSSGYGFWFETEMGDKTPWTSFRGNVAHSNAKSGFFQDRRPEPEPESVFQDLTSYKNRDWGVWIRSYGSTRLTNNRVADNRGGFYFASEGFQFSVLDYGTGLHPTGIATAILENSLVIGESSNTGEPTTCTELIAGRSLPQLFANSPNSNLPPWNALVGVEFYDGLIGVEDCVFAEFRDMSLTTPSCSSATFDRKGAALHPVWYNSPWAVDPRNYVTGLSFINDGLTQTVPIYLRQPIGIFNLPCGTQVDDGGIANSVFQDLDGCVTGIAGSAIFPANEFLLPSSATSFNSTWNAFFSTGPPSTPFAQLEFFHLNQLIGLHATSTLIYHAAVRDQWFVKAAPVLFACAAEETMIPRFVTNIVTDDIYELYYDPSAPKDEWAKAFSLTLQFTEPGRWAYVTVPLPIPTSTPIVDPIVDVEGVPAPAASDPVSLLFGPGNEYWYDLAAQRIHIKIQTTGTGTSLFDGHRTTFLVVAQ